MTTPSEVTAIIRQLQLEPHPEGGQFRRTWTHPVERDGRPLATAIVYLLTRGERSAWHRIDAAELWCFHAGDPLELLVSSDGDHPDVHVLGGDLARAHVAQAAVPPDAWQSAKTLGAYSLVGCVVTPGYVDAGFELAPETWRPR